MKRTFKSETERQEALKIVHSFMMKCRSDAQYRIYDDRERKILEAKIVPEKQKDEE